jgi:hypothetical protein
LQSADPPSKEYYYLCKNDYETEEYARTQQRAVEPWKNEGMNYQENINVKVKVVPGLK